MNELKIITGMNELVGKYNEFFPINNSIEMMKILNLVMEYHIKKQPLSFKILYTQLKISDLCARGNIKRMENKGWLRIDTLKTDNRVRIIRPTSKLISSYKNFYEKISKNKKLICSI